MSTQEFSFVVSLYTEFKNGVFEIEIFETATFRFQRDAEMFAEMLSKHLIKRGHYKRRGASVQITTDDDMTLVKKYMVS